MKLTTEYRVRESSQKGVPIYIPEYRLHPKCMYTEAYPWNIFYSLRAAEDALERFKINGGTGAWL